MCVPVSCDGEDVSVFAIALPNKFDNFLACVVVQFQRGQLHL